jgi:hypothetical protein
MKYMSSDGFHNLWVKLNDELIVQMKGTKNTMLMKWWQYIHYIVSTRKTPGSRISNQLTFKAGDGKEEQSRRILNIKLPQDTWAIFCAHNAYFQSTEYCLDYLVSCAASNIFGATEYMG